MATTRAKNLVGQRFERLLVIERAANRGDDAAWKCQCDCGGSIVSAGSDLRRGKAKSCGCWYRDHLRDRAASMSRHGHVTGGRQTPEWTAWHAMRMRCRNPNDKSFHNYGGRGIAVCERWESFEAFFADIGPRPSSSHSLDRFPDVNGDYEPGNVRWATRAEQGQNRRTTKLTAAAAREIRSLSAAGARGGDLANRFNVSRATISGVISGRAWKESA